jgi:hypothetical protein
MHAMRASPVGAAARWKGGLPPLVCCHAAWRRRRYRSDIRPGRCGNEGCGVDVRIGMMLPMSVSDGAARMPTWTQVRAVALAVEKITLRYRSARSPPCKRVTELRSLVRPSDLRRFRWRLGEVGARLGAHFARGCSVVLGHARRCSVLTWADGTSRRSGEWWRQSLQASDAPGGTPVPGGKLGVAAAR